VKEPWDNWDLIIVVMVWITALICIAISLHKQGVLH
jgi:hypothetical protein